MQRDTPPELSADELNIRLQPLVEAARTDASLRKSLLRDPQSALLAYGIPVAPGLRLRFVEADPSEIVIPLPKYEGSS
jgi:hypothetical protein